MAWYLSTPGLVVAFGGILIALRRWLAERHAEWVPLLAILLPFSLLYF